MTERTPASEGGDNETSEAEGSEPRPSAEQAKDREAEMEESGEENAA